MSTPWTRIYSVVWCGAAMLFAYGLYAWIWYFHNLAIYASGQVTITDTFRGNSSWSKLWPLEMPKWFLFAALDVFDSNMVFPIAFTLPLSLLIMGRWIVTGRWRFGPGPLP